MSMTEKEMMLAARVGRLQFDEAENTEAAIIEFNSLPTKEQILKIIAEEESQSK